MTFDACHTNRGEIVRKNFHTHSTWCDGKATLDEMASTALEKGFVALGFSSHFSEVPLDECVVEVARHTDYVRAVRALAARMAEKLRVYCGAEADFLSGVTRPLKAAFASLKLDYLIGSVHYVWAPDGAKVAVDFSPEKLAQDLVDHFDGSSEAFVKAYFNAEREMIATGDFDILGHADLVRKFNERMPFFDESASWYRDELEKTAEVIAASSCLVEVNTGAISRGWLNDVYPSRPFRDLLRARGVRFVLSSDAHAPAALDVGFADWQGAEDFIDFEAYLEGHHG